MGASGGVRLLQQATAVTLRIGQFVDNADGYTPETGLASGGTEISKNGGAFATGPTLGTHDAEGYYPISFTASHTSTYGHLVLKSVNAGVHRGVREDFLVVGANVFAAFNSGTESLDCDVVSLASNVITAAAIASGAIGSSEIAANAIGASEIAANAIGSSELATSAIDDIVAGVLAGLLADETGAGTLSKAIADILEDTATTLDGKLPSALVGGRMDSNVSAIDNSNAAAVNLALAAGVMVAGTVDSTVTPTTTQFECDDITEATADHYVGRKWLFTSGALVGQATNITAYSLVSGRGRFTVEEMTEAPANDDTGIIV